MRPRSSRTSNRGERPDRASCATRGRTTRRWVICALDTYCRPPNHRTKDFSVFGILARSLVSPDFFTTQPRPASGAGRCHDSPRSASPRPWGSSRFDSTAELYATPQIGRPTYSYNQGPINALFRCWPSGAGPCVAVTDLGAHSRPEGEMVIPGTDSGTDSIQVPIPTREGSTWRNA